MATSEGESTFLTSLNADRKKALSRQHKREELLAPMDSGQQILKLHNDLQTLADDLDEKVEGKLNANENAFFLAYKSFMYTVQKELKELKQKADEEETKTRRDLKIQSLEKRLDWFMNEALRLDELCKKYKKELDKWKGRAEALEDDRSFLENQIKQAKRTNKSLRGAVEKAQSSAYSVLVATDVGKQAAASSTLPPALQHAQETIPPPSEGSALMLEDDPNQSGLSKELEERYQKCVKRLKQQLESEQKLAVQLRAASDRQFTEPSELEAFFLQCVEQVRTEVEARRRAQWDEREASRGKSKQDSSSQPKVVTMDDFTISDRRRVVELLLSSKEVLHLVEEKINTAQGTGLPGLEDLREV